MAKVGLVQLRTPAGQGAALRHAESFIREAAAGGAKLIVTPEGTNLLQRDRTKLMSVLSAVDQDPCVAGLRGLAAELEVWLLIGSALVRRDDSKAANRSLLVDPRGHIVASYDKLHMFDVDLPTGEKHRESSTYEAGERAVIARAAGFVVGMTICYDLRFAALYRALAAAGAELLTVPSAFTRPTGEAHWEILLRARAIETGSFVVAPAQGGVHEDGRATWGRSMVVSPWGEVIARAESDEPCAIVAELDLDLVAKARRAIPALTAARAFVGP